MATVDKIIKAAEAHGKQSDPDHEVGDLQILVQDLWASLTPAQRKNFSGRIIDWDDFVKQWLGGS